MPANVPRKAHIVFLVIPPRIIKLTKATYEDTIRVVIRVGAPFNKAGKRIKKILNTVITKPISD